MKKIFSLTLLALLFVACSSDNNDEPEIPDDGYKVFQEKLVGQWISEKKVNTSYIVYQFHKDSTYTEYEVINEFKNEIKETENGRYLVTSYKTIAFDGKDGYKFEMHSDDSFSFGYKYKRDDETEYIVVED